jgi:aspartate aminotransferase
VYREFYYGSDELLSVMQIAGMDEHVIMLDSVSKKFSLCGARIGFFVTKSKALRAAALKFGQARLCSPTLDQYGVIAALRGTAPSYYETVRAEYMARRDLLVSELSSMPGVKCPKIDGAFYALVHLPIDDSDRFCQWLLTDFSHEGQTVLLAPATGFYITPGLGRQEVRIAYVLNRDRIKAAMSCLKAALEVYAKQLAGLAG